MDEESQKRVFVRIIQLLRGLGLGEWNHPMILQAMTMNPIKIHSKQTQEVKAIKYSDEDDVKFWGIYRNATYFNGGYVRVRLVQSQCLLDDSILFAISSQESESHRSSEVNKSRKSFLVDPFWSFFIPHKMAGPRHHTKVTKAKKKKGNSHDSHFTSDEKRPKIKNDCSDLLISECLCNTDSWEDMAKRMESSKRH